MIFLNSLIKSLINKIKKHKNFHNFLTSIDSGIRKENVKNKKTNSKQRNFGKNIFTYLHFLKELLEISRIR